MTDKHPISETVLPENGADLETVLEAWHSATVRLEKTHEALRSEVKRLTDELEVKNRELARKNRLADLGRMASHIAHEVRNNLVPVTLYLSLLRRRIQDDSGSLDVFDKIENAFSSLDVTVNDLLNFTSDRDPRLQTFPIGNLIDEVLGSIEPQLEAQEITVESDPNTCPLITADRDMLRRAVLNLMLNALDAMPNGGTLSVSTEANDQGVAISILDSGEGLSEDVEQRAFEPFFTTKQTGTGLGLAIVQRIAETHCGQVVGSNDAERGARFVLTIPRHVQEAVA